MTKERYTLRRFAATADGTLGRFGSWYTLEEEDQGNRTNVSRIPAGTYICERRWYNKGGYETFEVMDVPDRDLILFHILNTEEGTDGCIGLGLSVGTLKVVDEDSGERKYKIAVLSSCVAFREFMDIMTGLQSFTLIIEDEA